MKITANDHAAGDLGSKFATNSRRYVFCSADGATISTSGAHVTKCQHISSAPPARKRTMRETGRSFTRRHRFSLQKFAERSFGVFKKTRSTWSDGSRSARHRL